MSDAPGSGRSVASVLRRLGLWALTMTLVLALYVVGKFGGALREPTSLPLTAIDTAIPLIPWTVWPYSTITWACLLAWLAVPSRRDAARLLFAVLAAASVCAAVFLIFPTTYPRAAHPIALLPDSPAVRELWRLRLADSPTNCLPSLHVALAWTLALVGTQPYTRAEWSRRSDAVPSWAPVLLRGLALTWAAVVALTTLTTKQHYVVDVPTGAAVGVFAWWAARRALPGEATTFAWARSGGLALTWDTHTRALAKLRVKVEGYQWSLDEVEWPTQPGPPLDPTLVRLINELIYIEEIAGMNFALLAEAARDQADLSRLYALFAEEERRHAEGLRRVLAIHGAPLRPPGLGNSLVLQEFDALDPRSEADVLLIATANPVFETMLDAGTVPFLRAHPALASAYFDDFIARITRDESAHLAVNWMVVREAGERLRAGRRGLGRLGVLFNPSIARGMIAVPFMSLDVYSLAHRLGYRFETLLPAFGKLWRLHRRYTELSAYPLWWVFRLFTACGALATLVAAGLARAGLIFIRFWTALTRLTDGVARVVFGRRLLAKRGLPAAR